MFDASSDEASRVFSSIRHRLRRRLGHEPGIMVRTAHELEQLVEATPFSEYASESRAKFYVAFLAEAPARRPRFPLRSIPEALDAIGMSKLDAFIVSRQKKSGF